MEKKPRNKWKSVDPNRNQRYVTTTELEDADERAIYMKDLYKRKQVYGICGECNEPGTGQNWCQPCNAKRFEDNFKNWTSGNKDIDKVIQESQLNAVHFKKFLEWIPFEKFQNITYVAKGGFGKIYSAEWPEGISEYWDIENQKWHKITDLKVALKSLDNSSDICSDFLNEIKSHLEIFLYDTIQCFGVTQDPNTKDYMMVLYYCSNGNLRNFLNKYRSKNYLSYELKIDKLLQIARGLLDIHNAGKVHKDFHPGNILFSHKNLPFISDLGMCRPANKYSDQKERIYGVLPYVAPEVLRGHHYTKAADIYSFGIIMNEFLSEETPYSNISFDGFLAIKICQGYRPEISKNIPQLLADIIIKCWDAEIKNRPTTKELYQILKKWNEEKRDNETVIYSQLKECNEIGKKNFESRLSKNTQSHSQAIYTSKLLNFKNLPKPVNSSNLSSFQFNLDINNIPSLSILEIPTSECLDLQLNESANLNN
ncbi:kinase-like domain-containing protein [Rhizophagus irregularis DAOM 181602=DAOM 197198]|uniref:Kinase-like domain-containing protein n=1 Tax=Rhizophagus irregularis (strain DAOM 181602 / DAOM 197198 / MUCL 43194) TaxID=747089 RepID=A0A2P4P0K1_RHIID|nr:kinase-like domain-containing protein [Rhizophagus irregularis DAOM 181602=DAOM 197198]POG58898.1 kinase-like domain-containing protein [Rhizophagus irregularis DAOM 181602=DAOM 197198]|eukprot:XP_025165764.1 kinase-like domain-containing protein [Rhizophagus irregularis DAOM 181602=DAOM 197198]